MGVLESGFSGRSISFYSLPQARVFDRELTVSEALHEAGMDFHVEKRPVFQQLNNGDYVEVPGKFATYRLDTEAALGVVGNQYVPFQNESALAMVDELLGFGALIDAAGTWNNGADVFVTARLPEGIKVRGEEDAQLNLLFRNNHAGTGSVSSYCTANRISCTNMISSAIRGAVTQWKIRHTRTVNERVQEATAALQLVDTYKLAMEETVIQLQDMEMTIEEVDGFLKELTSAERVQNTIREVYNQSPTVTRGNAWGVFNSVTETLDHFPSRRSGPETRFASQLDGPNARTRDRAMRLLVNR